jgi:small subunit ribosomal protein S27e
MKKHHILVPEPKSKFQKVKCKECNEESIIYSHVTTVVQCIHCGNVLAEPTGSIAKIKGDILGSAE